MADSMHTTASEILNGQYSSQDLQMSFTYYLELEPANCEDVSLNPNVEANGLVSVKEEVEEEGHNITDLEPVYYEEDSIDPKVGADGLISVKEEVEEDGHNVTDFPEDTIDSYFLDPEAIHSDLEDDQLLIPICSNKSYEMKDACIGNGMKWGKRQEEENLCIIEPEKNVKNYLHPFDSTQFQQKYSTSNFNEEARRIYMKAERNLKKKSTFVMNKEKFKKFVKNYVDASVDMKPANEPNEQKIQKTFFNEDTQIKYENDVKTSVINTVINEFQCNKCSGHFSKEILTDHILSCTKTAETSVADSQLKKEDTLLLEKPLPLEMFSCDICTFKTYTKRSIENHSKMHNITKVLSCKICEYKCKNKCHLKIHMTIHTGEKPYSCNICEYRCAIKYNLKVHMKKHTGEKPFSCNICQYRCAHKSQLKSHMKKHTGEKPFSCNICEYRGAHKIQLKNHMIIHTGEKPLSCNFCEYRCANEFDLKKHMNKHTGEKPFSCSICEYRCARKHDLQRHMRKHSGEKPLSCNLCDYRCAYTNLLKQHIITHTGEKPYACNICKYACYKKTDLSRHMKTHSGEKPYTCDICGFRFAEKHNLKCHLQIHMRILKDEPF